MVRRNTKKTEHPRSRLNNWRLVVKNQLLLRVAIAATAISAGTTFAQNVGKVERQVNKAIRKEVKEANRGTNIRGSVVRVVPNQQMVVIRGADGREVSYYTHPKTVYRLNDPNGSLTALKPGTNVNIWYSNRDERQFVETLALTEGDVGAPVMDNQEVVPSRKVRGKVVGMASNPSRIMLRDDNGREITVLIDDTRDVTFDIIERDGAYYLASPGGPLAGNMTATTIEGTVVRVVPGDNQFVLRTERGEEVVILW